MNGELMRKLAAAIFVSALAMAATGGTIGTSRAADLPASHGRIPACAAREQVILFDRHGHPTAPARTPYFFCVTGGVLLPGDIPPPPEYCCR
jgi:hypothetical protein